MTNEVAECLAKVGYEMRVELSRCEIHRPPFHSTGVVCLSVEAFIGVLCEAIRSTNGKPLQNELVELGKNLMWEPERGAGAVLLRSRRSVMQPDTPT